MPHRSPSRGQAPAAKTLFGIFPRRNILRPLRQLAVSWDDSELLLPGKGLLAHLVPALVEFAPVLCDPVFRCVMRRMACTGCEINEEWFVRCDRLLLMDPRDRFIRQVFHEVIALFRRSLRLDRRNTVVKSGMVLIVLA